MSSSNFYQGDQSEKDEDDVKPTTGQEIGRFVAKHPIIVTGVVAAVYAVGFQAGHSRALLDVIRAAASATTK
jgi:hypothetical protein